MKLNTKVIINDYNAGKSLNEIARKFHTNPTAITRLLVKNNIELRHDASRKNVLSVKDGEKLIEWAKAQGRLVTKTELAKVIGKKKLSPSYFIKYPELGKYVISRERTELQEYNQKLYKWLQDNNIQYKSYDKSTIGVMVTALLLGDYSNIALQICIRPKCVSKKIHMEMMDNKHLHAEEKKVELLYLDESNFENLDKLKTKLDRIKVRRK